MMRKTVVRIGLVLILTAIALAQVPVYATCPVHWLKSTNTGRRKLVENAEFYEYRCPRSHGFWVRVR
jgi:hypothetical protein